MSNTAIGLSNDFNQKRAEEFAGNMVKTLNNAAVTLMISIGHRLGLFDRLAELPAMTSEGIANAVGLNERYVREWLGALVTGGIVEFYADEQKYKLPAEHAAFLTRAAKSENMAAISQFVPLLGMVEEKILTCFQNGGGLQYKEFPRFHTVMAEVSGNTVLPALIDTIVPLTDGLTEKLESGIEVLDVGCGSGQAINFLAQTFPNSHFTGYDFSEESIGYAIQEAKSLGLENVSFEVRDAVAIGEFEKYDLITAFDAIHDQIKPSEVLTGICAALKPDGTFLMQEIASSSYIENNLENPFATWLYTVSCLHCMTVSLANDGDGLGAMWGEEKARELLSDAGFKSIEVERIPQDIVNSYFIARKN